MFGRYPVFINSLYGGSDCGNYFCPSCEGLSHVNKVEFNVPVESSELRKRIFVPQCKFHGNELKADVLLTDLMAVTPKNNDGKAEIARTGLNERFHSVKLWDRAFCILFILGIILFILGLGILLAVNSFFGVPIWIPCLTTGSLGLMFLTGASLSLYKSGKASDLWKVDEGEFLSLCDLRSVSNEEGYDKYRILTDNFCIFETN